MPITDEREVKTMQTVYRYHIPGDSYYWIDPVDILYVVKGDALNTSDSYRDAMRKLERIKEEQFCYDGDLDEFFRTHDNAWRYVMGGDLDHKTQVTEWYPTKDDAEKRAIELGFDMERSYYAVAELSIHKTYPVTVPFEVELYRNDRGLYCKVDLHPEESGGFNEKFYFPDRSCRDKLYSGKAIVTKVTDKGNYGFIVATMKQYSRPDEAVLAEFLAKNDEYWNQGKIEMLDTPYGKLTRISNIILNKHTNRIEHRDVWIATPEEDGELRHNYYLEHLVSDEIPRDTITVEEEISVADFLCQGYQSCTLSELSSKFTRIPFDITAKYRTVKYRTDLYDEVVKCGVLRSYKFNDVDFVEIDDSCMLRFAINFTQEEVDKLVAMVNSINESATNAIKKRLRKNQYKLR